MVRLRPATSLLLRPLQVLAGAQVIARCHSHETAQQGSSLPRLSAALVPRAAQTGDSVMWVHHDQTSSAASDASHSAPITA